MPEILIAILVYFAFTISKQEKEKKEKSVSYQDIIDEYAESIENAKNLMNAVLEGKALQTSEDGEVTVAPGE